MRGLYQRTPLPGALPAFLAGSCGVIASQRRCCCRNIGGTQVVLGGESCVTAGAVVHVWVFLGIFHIRVCVSGFDLWFVFSREASLIYTFPHTGGSLDGGSATRTLRAVAHSSAEHEVHAS